MNTELLAYEIGLYRRAIAQSEARFKKGEISEVEYGCDKGNFEDLIELALREQENKSPL